MTQYMFSELRPGLIYITLRCMITIPTKVKQIMLRGKIIKQRQESKNNVQSSYHFFHESKQVKNNTKIEESLKKRVLR